MTILAPVRFAVVADVEPCYYCGLPADSIDHVVPRAVLEAVRDSGDEALVAAVTERRRRMVVPACRECNLMAGAVFDATLADRRQRVKRALRRRYRKALAMPDWSDTELMALSERLQRLVIAGLYERDEARRRVAW